MPRKGFAGAAVVTTITSNIASSGTGTFTIASATGWTFTTTPFVVVVDRGLAAEEKILCSGIAGTTVTMQTRGYDGTTQAAHNSPAQIIHIYDSVEADTANAHVFDTSRNDHTQYARMAASNTFTQPQWLNYDTPGTGTSGNPGLRVGSLMTMISFPTLNSSYVGENVYYDGTSWRYLNTAVAGILGLGNTFAFYNAASGTAGNVATLVDRFSIDVNGVLTNNAANLAQSLKAGFNVTGGGVITFDASGNLSWTTRMIVIAHGNGSDFSTAGFFDIGASPTSGTITGVGGASNVTATSAGIPLAAWTALYYILPIGADNTFVAANLRVATYSSALQVPPHWVLIAVRNADATPNYVRLCTGHILTPGAPGVRVGVPASDVEALGWMEVGV